MKIGVLTFHKSINNGAVMQCYSLTKRLQKEFPNDTVEVIDYHMPKVELAYTPSLRGYFANAALPVKIKRAVKLLMDPISLKWQKERKRAFESVSDILPLLSTSQTTSPPLISLTRNTKRPLLTRMLSPT